MRASQATGIRYIVLLLTVAAYMITYLDRVLMSSAMPTIQQNLNFSLVTLGWLTFAYQFAYGIFQIPGGWLGDRLGARVALTGVVLWWSLFTALIPFTWSALSLGICLFLFGMGEAGAFPIANRSLARWMLPSERGLAQGSTHAGSRLGGAMTPVIVVALIAAYGWHMPFYLFAAVGLVWAGAWFWYYRDSPHEHASVNAQEREILHTALGRMPARTRNIPWKLILTSPQMWLLAAMYFCYGYDVSIFLSWFPKYLSSARGFNLSQMGLYASLPLLAGFTGALCGGTLSDHLLRRTGRVRQARTWVSASGFLLAAVTIPLAALSGDALLAVGFFCAAVFGLELTVGVSWAITLDVGGEYAGSVSAFMNTFGNLGGALAGLLMGYMVTWGGWEPPFLVMGALALLGALLVWRIDPARRVQA